MATTVDHCRACRSRALEIVLDLGSTPLANRLLSASELHQAEQRFPLALAFCNDCSLVQITETVPAEILFRHYLYFSSFSDALVRHAAKLVEQTLQERRLDEKSLVMEVASNDGYLLQHYRRRGVPVLGIEPAENIAAACRHRGIPTISEFFEPAMAARLATEGRRADVIHANNVLAHFADPNDFFAALKVLLAANGAAIVEVPYVKDMIDSVEFDTIYHEHRSYFSLRAMNRLCASHGLIIARAERLAIHGGSLRVWIEHPDNRAQTSGATALLDEEQQWGVHRPSFYRAFGSSVQALRARLLGLIEGLKKRGGRIAAYGCSAKGSTLLNYFGIGRETLDFVVDRSTAKQGLFTPGAHLPVFAPDKLLESMPGHALLLTWNFEREILDQQAEYRKRGGHFIVPIPEPRIV